MYEPREDLDGQRILEVALALLSLSRHEDARVWKGMDWDILNELHSSGWISNPKSKAKSVVLSPEGEALADEFLLKYFRKET